MKQLIQAIAGRFGYFIIKRATLDELINELAKARARISSLEQQNRVLDVLDARISELQSRGHSGPASARFVERLIGTIRRECVDHIVALGEQHLRRFVKSYASYYNTARTHRL